MKMTDIEFAFEWTKKAEHDLFIMRLGLDNADTPSDVLCFLAQQAAEKALKGVLTVHKVEFKRTHDLMPLYLVAAEFMPVLRPEQADLRQPDYVSKSHLKMIFCPCLC